VALPPAPPALDAVNRRTPAPPQPPPPPTQFADDKIDAARRSKPTNGSRRRESAAAESASRRRRIGLVRLVEEIATWTPGPSRIVPAVMKRRRAQDAPRK